MGIDAHAVTARSGIEFDFARTRRKVAVRVFRIDAALNRVTARDNLLLRVAELESGGNADLFLDDVHARHHFGNRVFDLDAGVHFHEIELLLRSEKEFDGSGADVFDRLRRLDRRLAQLLAERGGDGRGRGLLDQLLVTALHAAVALAELEDIAEGIRENLNFDVFRVLDEFFDVDVAVAESLFRFGFRGVESLNEAGVIVGDTHAASAAARRSLDDNRVFEFAGNDKRLFFGFDHAAGAGGNGNAGLAHGVTGAGFVAHRAHLFRRGPDKGDVAAFADFREVNVLRKEPVSGVNGVDIADLSDGDDAVDQQVAVARLRGTDAHRLIGEFDGQTVFIRFGVDEDGFDAHLFARADDPQGDFATVGDQDLVKHGNTPGAQSRDYSMTKSGCPYSTGCPFSARISLMTPDFSALISFMTFMASMMQTVVSGSTLEPILTKASTPGAEER